MHVVIVSMKICSYNIRGLGGRAKKKEIQQLVRTQRLDVLGIQETKTENLSRTIGMGLWDDVDFDWA